MTSHPELGSLSWHGTTGWSGDDVDDVAAQEIGHVRAPGHGESVDGCEQCVVQAADYRDHLIENDRQRERLTPSAHVAAVSDWSAQTLCRCPQFCSL